MARGENIFFFYRRVVVRGRGWRTPVGGTVIEFVGIGKKPQTESL